MGRFAVPALQKGPWLLDLLEDPLHALAGGTLPRLASWARSRQEAAAFRLQGTLWSRW
jgi:hypothetical protein